MLEIYWLTYLDIQLGFLQLEVVFFTPRLFSLLHRGHGKDLDVSIVDNFIAVFVPADADLQSFSYCG